MSCSVNSIELPKPKPVRVNGLEVARSAISREAQNHPAQKPIEAWQSAARALVVRELLLSEAKRLALEPEPLSEDGRTETEDEALIRQLLESEVTTPEPDEVVCLRYYQQHISRFHAAAIYEASHILIAADKRNALAYRIAQGKIERIVSELRLYPEKFETLASLHSDCPSSKQGGNLGQLTAGQTTPEFEQVLFSLAADEISAPVQSRYGLHVIRLERKIDGRQIPFEAAHVRIAEYLKDSVRRRASAQYIALLVSRAEIEGIDLATAMDHRVN